MMKKNNYEKNNFKIKLIQHEFNTLIILKFLNIKKNYLMFK